MNFIFDCNILISAALLPDSIPSKSIDLALKKGNIISSPQTISELRNALNKPKLRKYITLKDKLSFISKFEASSISFQTKQSIKICRDPKDDIYLELAISGNASYIVTGDKDLLILNPFRNIPIITPKEFIDIFE